MINTSEFQDVKVNKRSDYPEISYDKNDSDIFFVREKTLTRDRAINLSGNVTESQKIKFRIQSGNFFLNPVNTYLQLEVTIAGLADASERAYVRLSPIGVFSLFRECRISQGGSTIELIRDWDVLSRIIQTRLPEDYRQKVLQASGVFDNGTQTIGGAPLTGGGPLIRRRIPAGTIAIDAGTRIWTVGAALAVAAAHFLVGDRIYLRDVANVGRHYTVTRVAPGGNANEIEVDRNSGFDQAARNVAVAGSEVYIERPDNVGDYGRLFYPQVDAGTPNRYVMPMLPSGFFNSSKWFPMFVNKNDLELEFTMNLNNIILDDTGTGAAITQVQINDAHIVYEQLFPRQSIIAKVQEMYLKQGLIYPMNIFTTIERSTVASTTIDQQYIENLTLLNRFYCLARPVNFTDFNIPSYQFEALNPEYVTGQIYLEINSMRYPSQQFDQIFPADVFFKNHYSHNILGSTLYTNQSLKEFQLGSDYIISIDLEKYNNGMLTGLNIQNQTVRLIVRGIPAPARARNIFAAFESTAFLQLKNSSPITVFT